MKRVLFYCQHLVGIGHVSRSLALVNELSRSFELTYVQGGPALAKQPLPAVKLVQLDPLLMREKDNSLYDPNEKRSVESIFSSRERQLEEIAKIPFDAVIVELYPFGRKKFGKEILSLLVKLRAANPRIRALVSVRDILVTKPDSLSRDPKIADLVNQHFDAVLVHSDPDVLRFEKSFTAVDKISDKIFYTGFVAEPASETEKNREKKILLSLGGGSVGHELYRACAKVVDHLPDFSFHFVFGPYTDPKLKQEISEITKRANERVEFSDLLPNFEEALASSALSISMAGYNTVMNLLNTRTPALVFPYGANLEQETRAALLKDYIGLLGPEDLQEGRLLKRMQTQMAAAYPTLQPNLRGAVCTREYLERLL
jgi:predicted glycosyltransferase